MTADRPLAHLADLPDGSLSQAEVRYLLAEIVQLRDALKGRTQSCSRCNEAAAENERLRGALTFDYDAIYGSGGKAGQWRAIHDYLAEKYGLDMIQSGDSELNLGHAREVIAIVVEGFLATTRGPDQ